LENTKRNLFIIFNSNRHIMPLSEIFKSCFVLYYLHFLRLFLLRHFCFSARLYFAQSIRLPTFHRTCKLRHQIRIFSKRGFWVSCTCLIWLKVKHIFNFTNLCCVDFCFHSKIAIFVTLLVCAKH
jgi:hypothetical protein